jgi:hypothetical protein
LRSDSARCAGCRKIRQADGLGENASELGEVAGDNEGFLGGGAFDRGLVVLRVDFFVGGRE